MLSKIQSALTSLLAPGESLLAGVSGGADSVALLDVLVEGGWRPHVCHLNHKLRGADSDADAEFVGELAGKYGLLCTIGSIFGHVGGVFNPGRSRLQTAPTEETLRQARFEFFESVAQRTGIKTLALAHTADDQVETFLLRLLRGAGVPGLVGIWPERRIGSLRVVRPLLRVTRDEVLEYLKARGLSWREDASNTDTRFTRNRIRHQLLPLLEREFNPAIREVLLRTAEILRDEDELLEKLLEGRASTWPDPERTCRSRFLQIQALRDQPVAVQRRLLRFWLGVEDELGSRFSFDQIEAVRELAAHESPSGEVHLPDDLVVYREYEWLRTAKRRELQPVQGQWPVKPDGETKIAELGVLLVSSSVVGAASSPRPVATGMSLLQEGRSEECFDADALGVAPFVRTWQKGDRFQPLGMSGEKKVQDFFVDEKVPRLNRGRVPLLCATDGRIAWVVGFRIAEQFKVTDATRRVVRIVAQEL